MARVVLPTPPLLLATAMIGAMSSSIHAGVQACRHVSRMPSREGWRTVRPRSIAADQPDRAGDPSEGGPTAELLRTPTRTTLELMRTGFVGRQESIRDPQVQGVVATPLSGEECCVP